MPYSYSILKCYYNNILKTNFYHFQLVIKDYVLALFVLCLVVIDILILGSYTAIEGSRDSLGVRLTSNKENIDDTIGVSCDIFLFSMHSFTSNSFISIPTSQHMRYTATIFTYVKPEAKWLFLPFCLDTKDFCKLLLSYLHSVHVK